MENELTIPTRLSVAGSKTYDAMVRKYQSEMGPLTLDGVADYLRRLSKVSRPSTVRVTKYALQNAMIGMVHDARAHEMIRASFRRIKTARPDRVIHGETVLTAEQVQALAGSKASPRARLLVRALSTTGTRLAELLGMKLADCETIETKAGPVVSVRIIGKGQKERRVFLSVGLFAEIVSTFKGKVWLFETSNGKAISPRYARGMVYSVARSAGIRGVHPHTFRHTYATLKLKAGHTLKAVSHQLGHSTVAVTSLFYDHNELTPAEALGVGA